MVAGWASGDAMAAIVTGPDLRYRPLRRERLRYAFAPGIDGTSLTIPLEIICGASDGPHLAVVAGVHGDELEGVRAIQALSTAITCEGLAGTLLLVPIANLPAYTARTRRGALDGVDLNRVFPGRASGSISEQLAHALVHVLFAEMQLVVSLHGLGGYGTLLPWMEFVDVPGPVGQASYAAARAFGFADLMPLPLLPGVLIAALAARSIPAIEGEIGGQGMIDATNWQRYVSGVMGVMRHLGMLAGPTMPALAPRFWDLYWIAAPAGGLFERRVALGEQVASGQTLGIILDPFGDVIGEVVTPCDGVIGAYQTFASVYPGEQIILVWRRSRPRHVNTTS
ncbi:MAG: succinylglutamate desuccinylase/aspartoacylase family protein [Chloroflexi bacterium]|nr:succinylglutamate desuccinylase/aspartoacylase family protein [Chloroflexota bacterium]